MGFGSYDESEQETQEIDTDIEESDRSTLAEQIGRASCRERVCLYV